MATQLRADPDIPALVDDLGGWLTATLDHRCWDDAPINPEVDDLVAAISGFHAPLALVSPEVGLTVVPMTAAGRRFTDELGALNQRLAACCERVVLDRGRSAGLDKAHPDGHSAVIDFADIPHWTDGPVPRRVADRTC